MGKIGNPLITKRRGYMTIKVCVAGATGWAGSALTRGLDHVLDLN